MEVRQWDAETFTHALYDLLRAVQGSVEPDDVQLHLALAMMWVSQQTGETIH